MQILNNFYSLMIMNTNFTLGLYQGKIMLRCFFIFSIFYFSAFGQEDKKVSSEEVITNNSFNRRYLAMDNTLHGKLNNMKMIMGQAKDQKKIFQRFDDSWLEVLNIDGYEYICGVFRDHNGLYRMYYNVIQPALRTSRMQRREAMAVAFSNDGIYWTRPALNIAPNLIDHPSSNLINIDSHSGMDEGYWYRSGPVFYDEHASEESRYKLSWRVGHDIYVSTSSDGLNFITHGVAINHTADAQHAAFYDYLKGEYVMYGRKRGDWKTGPSDRRGIPRHSSENWTDIPWTNIGEVVIDPMDVWDYNTGIWPQVYTPAIQIYHGQYIGLPSIFYTDSKRIAVPRPERITGPFFPMVMYSHDGKQWTFPDLKHSIVDVEPHERISSYEHASFKGKEVGMVCTASNFIEVGDSLYIYYTVRESNHYEQEPLDEKSIHVAFMRIDGFASVQTNNDEQGEWITTSLRVPRGTDNLMVNANIFGKMQVEVLDCVTGRPFKGLELDNSLVITGDRTDFIIEWRDSDFDKVAGRSVRLRFLVKHGAIYSFSFKPCQFY
jgi:hypothetical protein